MLIFEGVIKEDIAPDDDRDLFECRPDVYTNVFILGYRLTEHYLHLTIADDNFINCADIYLLTDKGYDKEFQELMRSIYAIHKDGSISVEGLEDFYYRATCEWRDEYGAYFVKKLTPIMETYCQMQSDMYSLIAN